MNIHKHRGLRFPCCFISLAPRAPTGWAQCVCGICLLYIYCPLFARHFIVQRIPLSSRAHHQCKGSAHSLDQSSLVLLPGSRCLYILHVAKYNRVINKSAHKFKWSARHGFLMMAQSINHWTIVHPFQQCPLRYKYARTSSKSSLWWKTARASVTSWKLQTSWLTLTPLKQCNSGVPI